MPMIREVLLWHVLPSGAEEIVTVRRSMGDKAGGTEECVRYGFLPGNEFAQKADDDASRLARRQLTPRDAP